MTTIKPNPTDENPLGSIGHVSIYQDTLLRHSLTEGDTVVDATLGNGHDAAKILALIGKTGFLYGFDIQNLAIETSENRLKASGHNNFKLICADHAQMKTYLPDNIQGFVFNLGYLPKGDKQMTTTWATTQLAIESALELVKPNGFVSVMTYPGHESGMAEDSALTNYFSGLDQSIFQVALTQFINQQNHPPKLYWLTKRARRK